MKKRFWDTTLWKVLKVAIGMVINNQKGIKGTDNVKKIDEVLNNIP
jgi:hypothetical protein